MTAAPGERSDTRRPSRSDLADLIAPPTLEEVRAELGRRHFRRFVALMRPAYQLTWYHEVICAEVQAWVESEEPYHLILSMPPGHAKSEYAKLALAWIATRDRGKRLVYASYAQDLADQQLRDVQGILDSEEYLAHYPTMLNPRRAKTDESRGAKRTGDYAEMLPCKGDRGGGFVKSIGRGGGLTGFRADIIALDDLVKDHAEASSPATRNAVWHWITSVAFTRASPDRPTRLIVTATRWHLEDATGRLLEHLGHKCREVRFEALREDMSDPRDPRRAGEALWPAVADEAALEEQRALDPDAFVALYQQRPTPIGGTLYQAAWIPRYDALPRAPGRWLQSWDLRGGGKTDAGSYVVGLLAFIPSDAPAQCYIVDMIRHRFTTEETLATYLRLATEEPVWSQARERLVEQAADGKGLIPAVRATAPAIAVKPRGDKWLRARAVQPVVRAGQVLLPQRGAWLGEWLHEVTTFPGASSDDIVDALSQLLDHLYGEEVSQARVEVHQRRKSRARDLARY